MSNRELVIGLIPFVAFALWWICLPLTVIKCYQSLNPARTWPRWILNPISIRIAGIALLVGLALVLTARP
jgi:hypothetical protein